MKRLFLFAAFLIAGGYFTSCQKESVESTENSYNSIQSLDLNFDIVDFTIAEKFKQLAASNEARLVRLGIDASRECVPTAIVPDNYATIQEAVDAVCEYGDVIVKSGTYNESVVVYKTGLHIKAIGNVTVNGGFAFPPDLDNVEIQNFSIDNTTALYLAGIGGYNNNGCAIKQNNIYGAGHIGIYFGFGNNISIVQNNVSGAMDYGIFIDSFVKAQYVYEPSDNNTIANNIVTGINASPGIAIILRDGCNNNMIRGNTVNSSDYGIVLLSNSADDIKSCKNNIVKNNVSKNNLNFGIGLLGVVNNTIGPNNTSDDNGNFGIFLNLRSGNNYVFNNSAMNNLLCDIENYGTNNTFMNNTANCTTGVY